MTLEDLRVFGYFQTDHSSQGGMLYLGSSQSLKLAISRAITSVVTQFWTPRAGDGVYLFWTECRSLAHIRQKIDKSTKINMLFFNLVWAVFCFFFILPLCCQNRQVFLDWSKVFIMPNSFLFYLVFKVEKNPSEFALKKMVLLLSQFFVPT
jgi:hypothetical protein